jgi:hypothetical protein
MTIPRFALRDKATHWLLKRYIYIWLKTVQELYFSSDNLLFSSLWYSNSHLWYTTTPSFGISKPFLKAFFCVLFLVCVSIDIQNSIALLFTYRCYNTLIHAFTFRDNVRLRLLNLYVLYSECGREAINRRRTDNTMAKRKKTKGQTTIYKSTQDRATSTPHKAGGERRCSGKANSSCSICDNHRVAPLPKQ